MRRKGCQANLTRYWYNHLAYKPRSARTSTVQSAGMLGLSKANRRSQCPRHCPFFVAGSTHQATGIAQPRYITLTTSTVNTCLNVVASRAKASLFSSAPHHDNTQPNKPPKQFSTFTLRRFAPRLAAPSYVNSLSCCRTLFSWRPSSMPMKTAMLVSPHDSVSTIPKLYKANTRASLWLKLGSFLDTISVHSHNSSWRCGISPSRFDMSANLSYRWLYAASLKYLPLKADPLSANGEGEPKDESYTYCQTD